MSKQKARSFLYSVRALLAGAVLYFALDLSHGDRGTIDYVVLAVVLAAIAWNLVRLGQRLYGAGGNRALWHEQRTVLFWIIGLLNTVAIDPADAGTWKNWLGWLILAVAVADTVLLILKERAVLAEASSRDPAIAPSAGVD